MTLSIFTQCVEQGKEAGGKFTRHQSPRNIPSRGNTPATLIVAPQALYIQRMMISSM